MTPLSQLPKVRSDALRKSARGQPCSIRLPFICNHDNSTTVLAHLPGIGKGTGTKVSDIHSAFACSACHDAVDGRRGKAVHTEAELLDAMLRGHCETMAIWVEMGLITGKDWEIV